MSNQTNITIQDCLIEFLRPLAEGAEVKAEYWVLKAGVREELDHFAEYPVTVENAVDCENLLRAIECAQDDFTPEQEEQLAKIAIELKLEVPDASSDG